MSGSRREAIVVFAPPEDADWHRLDRRERSTLLRNEVQQHVEQMLDDLHRAGMAAEADVLDGAAARGIPAGAVLVRATPRALKVIRRAKGVIAVADADTQLTTCQLSA
jgi:hypothetical protein